MTAEHYHALRGWFEAHPLARRCVVTLDRWLPLIPFVCYPVLLCLLNVQLFRLFSGKAGGAPDFMIYRGRSDGSYVAESLGAMLPYGFTAEKYMK